jgi:CheY-like chemotaxis protein
MTALHKVLVVDDDPVIGKSFDRVLSKKGYVVITARDGEDALAKLNAESYDAVFTDIKMPGMNGLEVAERVKAKRPWTPVVIITGYGTGEEEKRAEAAGVCEFLHKPLSPEMIERSARHAVAAPARAPAKVEEAPAKPEAAAAEAENSTLKNVALFLASPFFGFAYLVAFPIFSLAMIGWLAIVAARKNHVMANIGRIAKHAVMMLAGPFVALAFVVAFPVLAIATLAWIGGGAALKRTETR